MRTMCERSPELWWSDIPADIQQAQEACMYCPIQATCLAQALERGESGGVWGGVRFHRGKRYALRICNLDGCSEPVVQARTGAPKLYCSRKHSHVADARRRRAA